MTREIVEKLEKEVKKQQLNSSKEQAKRNLQAAGIVDKNGKISEPYKDIFLEK